MTVGAVSWKVRRIQDAEEFFAHFEQLARDAKGRGCELLVFPELIALELLALEETVAERDVPQNLAPHSEAWEDLAIHLADELDMLIVAGSWLVEEESGFSNTAFVAYPSRKEFQGADGTLVAGDYQTKVQGTAYEKEVWSLVPGKGLQRLLDGRIGVTICYDAEFPEAARALAGSGAEVICVPSYTEKPHGFERVRNCCLARATENQVFVLHSALVGGLGREPVVSAAGTSAIIAPSFEPFPCPAILDETRPGEEGIAVATLDFDALREGRERGAVRPWQDSREATWQLLESPWR